MKLRDWLLPTGTLISGYLAGRYIKSYFPTNSSLPTNTKTAQPKLTRENVIHLIEANGGSEGLDLSDYDLAGIDLSRLDLRGVLFAEFGNLKRTIRSANLVRTNLRYSNLFRSNLTHVDMRGADLWRANLQEANCAFADAEGASFRMSNLQNCNLYGCNLTDSNLWRANLEGANLWVAKFSNAFVTEANIGHRIIQESQVDYEEYHKQWHKKFMNPKDRQTDINRRFAQAAEIYMNLKNAYMSHGRYREASHAYLKERRMRRATYVLWRVKRYHGAAIAENPGILRWRWLWFYPKYMGLWFFDWLTDLGSGYGEKPLRTVWLALLVIFAFPWLYWLSGQIALADNSPLQWIDYLIYSLGAFTTMNFDRFVTIGWIAETIASLEALLGISILALLMFALGNRISRS